jgi:heme A synthase
MKRARDFALIALAVNVIVILLGALVRATGSGAGCGRSWPTCNGTFVPELEGATAIEFAHRASSGIALILVAIMVWMTFRATHRGHPARLGAIVSGISIIVEALIGAVIVLAEWVANDASLARAISVPIHLVSTFVLLGGLVLTVFWLDGGPPIRLAADRRTARAWMLIALGMLIIGATGGVTALADTLFPKDTFEIAGIFETESTAHFLTRLRALHPAVALLVGFVAARWAISKAWSDTGRSGRAGRAVVVLVGVQFLLGAVNVVLLTPVWLSLLHLALADAVWVAWVWLGAELLQERSGRAPTEGSPA